MNTLNIKLGEILKERDITQAELAKLTGLRPASVSEIVNNQRTTINKEHFVKIANVLEIKNISELMELSE